MTSLMLVGPFMSQSSCVYIEKTYDDHSTIDLLSYNILWRTSHIFCRPSHHIKTSSMLLHKLFNRMHNQFYWSKAYNKELLVFCSFCFYVFSYRAAWQGFRKCLHHTRFFNYCLLKMLVWVFFICWKFGYFSTSFS